MRLQRDDALRELALLRQVLQVLDDGLAQKSGLAQSYLEAGITLSLDREKEPTFPKASLNPSQDSLLEQVLVWGRLWLKSEDLSLAGFDEDYYRLMHNDIDVAIRNGHLKSGLRHWLTHGAGEDRAYRFTSLGSAAELCAVNDRLARRARESIMTKFRALLRARPIRDAGS